MKMMALGFDNDGIADTDDLCWDTRDSECI